MTTQTAEHAPAALTLAEHREVFSLASWGVDEALRQRRITPERAARLDAIVLKLYRLTEPEPPPVVPRRVLTVSGPGSDSPAPDPIPDHWISPQDAATRLGITDRAVVKRCTKGQLTARIAGARWRIDPASLE